ncbi:urea transporter [Nitrosophilus alvini]|uniref:urea transporter n=1 Tax=Nitrosophilus alvini TaxID=2714855 RepID=UPI00190BC468|nr:urea transporter [Nitrosophilus alvini]
MAVKKANQTFEILKPYISSVISSYAEVLFIESKKVGLLLLIASFINPNVALSGLLGVLFALFFAALIRMDPDYLESGFYIYNPLLVGMSIGFLFKLTFMSLFLIAVASVLTFLITIILHTLFSIYLIPILSFPFAIVSSIVYLSTLNYSNLFVETLYSHSFLLNSGLNIPVWCEAYFKSLGTILFMPNIWAGIFIFLLIVLHSRIMAIMTIAGFYFGVFVHSQLSGSYIQSLLNPYAFNYILVAVALGSIFLIPGIRSYLLALLGVSISVLLVDATAIFWTLYKIPVFTLPFNITVISFLFVLRLVRFREFAYVIKKTPENSLSYFLLSLFRFKSNEKSIFLPFSGKWSVYQAFDDVWTHQGKWKYAYDFVIRDKDGKTYKNEGLRLDDYYAFKKPVLSPVSGYVVEAADDFPDQPIGEVDNINNWGNYLILSTPSGVYVEISHLAKDSLKVKKGDFVEAGQIIGLCGNSGYSPEPHIHIQVQENMYLGSKTIPFNFVAYLKKDEVCFYQRPLKGDEISSFAADKSLDTRFSFVLESRCSYEVFKDEKKIDEFTLRVAMDRFSGRFFFEDPEKNKLFFAKEYGIFYFYDYTGKDRSYLKKFFMAIPRIALIGKERVKWEDFLTPRIVYEGFKKDFLMFLASICSKPFLYKGVWEKNGDDIKGTINIGNRQISVLTVIDKTHGFDTIKVENLIIRRKK